MRGHFVKAKRFEIIVREIENGAAGRLVNAAAFHTDEPVFHDVEDADAVFAAELVEPDGRILTGADILADQVQ